MVLRVFSGIAGSTTIPIVEPCFTRLVRETFPTGFSSDSSIKVAIAGVFGVGLAGSRMR